MATARIIREVCVAETREVILDANEAPIAARFTRLTDPERLHMGDCVTGRLRKIDLTQGGGFVEITGQAEAFLRLKDGHGFTEGQELELLVVAEERRDEKIARVVLKDRSRKIPTAPVWQELEIVDVPPGDAEVAAAFDEILSNTLTLPGGGLLSIERTRALIAADIDTAGRTDSGRAASRALKINLAAAKTLARQICLRNLGGLVVLDCVGPLNRDSGQKIRDGFERYFAQISPRPCRVIAPTEFGLLQTSIVWGPAPHSDRLLGPEGALSAETICMNGFRLLEQAARSYPMDRLGLELPAPAYGWLMGSEGKLEQALSARYGSRFQFSMASGPVPQIARLS